MSEVTRAKAGITKQKLYKTLIRGHPVEPSTYKEAAKYIEWQVTMATELLALHKNHTRSLFSRPSNTKIIDCKWFFVSNLNQMEVSIDIGLVWLPETTMKLRALTTLTLSALWSN